MGKKTSFNLTQMPHWSALPGQVQNPAFIQQKVEAGTKFDFGKPPLELCSTIAMRKKAMVLDFGRQKYDAHNWRKGMSWSRLLGAAARHLFAYIGGEDKDPETGLSHLAHLACCVDFLLEYEDTHTELDDRWKGVKNA